MDVPSARRPYLQAITALARVRRLQLPALQVNIARQQIVANGTAMGGVTAPGEGGAGGSVDQCRAG